MPGFYIWTDPIRKIAGTSSFFTLNNYFAGLIPFFQKNSFTFALLKNADASSDEYQHESARNSYP